MLKPRGRSEAAGLARGGRWDERDFLLRRFGEILWLHRLKNALDRLFSLQFLGAFLQFIRGPLAFQRADISHRFAIHDHRGEKQLVCTKALLGDFAIHHRVGEPAHVAGRFPNLRVHDDGGFQADDIIAAADHVIPPSVADVFFQLDAQRAVIPEAVDAAVDFRRLKNESPALA